MKFNNKYSILSTITSTLSIDNSTPIKNSPIKILSKRSQKRINKEKCMKYNQEQIKMNLIEANIIIKPNMYHSIKSKIFNMINIIFSHFLFSINFTVSIFNEVFSALFQEDIDTKMAEFKKRTEQSLKSNRRDIEELKIEINSLKNRLDNVKFTENKNSLSPIIAPTKAGPSIPTLCGPPIGLSFGPPLPVACGPPPSAFTPGPPLGLVFYYYSNLQLF